MNYKSNIKAYKLCTRCKVILTKSTEEHCSSCKQMKSSTKSTAPVKYRAYMTRFNSKNNKNVKCFQIKYSGFELGKTGFANNTKIQRSLKFNDSTNSEKAADFSFCLEFNNINDLSGFILKSKQINLAHLLLVGAKKLQSVPKIHRLIENQEELSPLKIFYPKSSTCPYTSSLQLLTKSSFWGNLLNTYFRNYYEKAPIFSIANFDPKTAPQSLMSSIYYAGYKSQPDQPEGLTLYMENYAKENLKLLIRECSLSAIQALLIYFLEYYREGNISLHYTCRAHATRIGYALGIHLDNKIFSELERYTRRLVFIRLQGINIVGSSTNNLSASFLTEFGSLNMKPIEPKWQTLNKSSVIYYNDENERLLHGVCCANYINFVEEFKYSLYNSFYNNVKDSRYKSEWNKTRKEVTSIYQKHIRVYQSLNTKYPNYIQLISKYEFQSCGYYHDCMIDMYSKLINKIDDLSSSDIDQAVRHLDWMLNCILSNNQILTPAQTHIILLGYQYICLYKLCNRSTKQTIQAKLSQIIQVLSTYYTPSNALSFIILKSGYKSIINDNIN